MLEILSVAQVKKPADAGSRSAEKLSSENEELEEPKKSFQDEFEPQETRQESNEASKELANNTLSVVETPDARVEDEKPKLSLSSEAITTDALGTKPEGLSKPDVKGEPSTDMRGVGIHTERPWKEPDRLPSMQQTRASDVAGQQGDAPKPVFQTGPNISRAAPEKTDVVSGIVEPQRPGAASPASTAEAIVSSKTTTVSTVDGVGRNPRGMEVDGVISRPQSRAPSKRALTAGSPPFPEVPRPVASEVRETAKRSFDGEKVLPKPDPMANGLVVNNSAPKLATLPQISQGLVPAPIIRMTEKSEVQLFGAFDLEAVTTWESRSAGVTVSTTQPQIFAKLEMPAMIGRQMAEALQRLPDRPVEVALNPSELGRVRMSISAAEAGITVTVLTERPETLDLMRRNIDLLAGEFEVLGYDNINFAFAEGHQGQGSQDDRTDKTDTSYLELEPAKTAADRTMPVPVSSGLDLRL